MPATILNLIQTQGCMPEQASPHVRPNSIPLSCGTSISKPEDGRLARRQLIYTLRHRPPHGHPWLAHGPVVRAIFSRSPAVITAGLSILYCIHTYMRACVRAYTALLLVVMPECASSTRPPLPLTLLRMVDAMMESSMVVPGPRRSLHLLRLPPLKRFE